MKDRATGSSVRVSTNGTAGPYIRLPYDQVDEVKRLLAAHNIHCWVSENIISLSGGPFYAVVNLGRAADAAAVQRLLDTAP
jgi:hypothetical protein